MKSVSVIISSHLWVRHKDLPREVEHDLIDALTLNNLEYDEALQWNSDDLDEIEPEIVMYESDGEWLAVPRGFASQLSEGMEAHGIHIDWDDQRTRKKGFRIGKQIPARSYQEKFIDAALEVEQGIAVAPTGAGKTVAVLEVIRRTAGPSIVVVNTKEIADQWIARTKQWLGEAYPVSMIGDNEFEISTHLTVALNPTLWSRREELEDSGFFDLFTVAVLDECHHATARTYKYTMGRFSSKIRFGVSATPKKTGDFRLAEMTLGEIFVEITEDDVETQIMKPEIQVIETDLGKNKKKKSAMQQYSIAKMSYERILRLLTYDKDRNSLIARNVVHHHGDRFNLVLSKRLDHLAALWDAIVAEGYPEENMLTIVGMDSREDRARSIARAAEDPCVIFSTLADEALDAPRLDRLHLCWPTKNTDLVSQQIGRIRRRHPEKKDSIVIDYRDLQVRTLNNQYMERRHGLYNPKGWTVNKLKEQP